jgi:hypothetical protein
MPQQARPLPEDREITTRSRSLLFLTAGLALGASVGPDVPVYIPENGFIGINVPLTRARSGSYSTRTTHPYFVHRLQAAAGRVGVNNPILNPFRLETKGEILAGSRNPGLLKELAPDSISCSHPEAARYAGRKQGNCGYCFPCLIRRSSMAHVGWDSPDGYAWDALNGKDLLDLDTDRAVDLRAVINGVYVDRPDRDILRNGPIPNSEHKDFLRLARRHHGTAGLVRRRRRRNRANRQRAETIQRRLLDTHCHVGAYDDPVAMLRAAEEAGVAVVAVTEDPDEYRRLKTRLGRREHVHVAIGLHPLRAASLGPNDLARFFRLLPQAEWIGEVGLDFSQAGAGTAKAQQRVFDTVLAEAQRGGLQFSRLAHPGMRPTSFSEVGNRHEVAHWGDHATVTTMDRESSSACVPWRP